MDAPLPIEHLRKRSEFLAASKSGNRWVTPAFIIQIYARVSEGPIRYGITASRKVGGAVDRNRAKRRLRALIRDILPSTGRPGTDYVFVARQEVLKRDFAVMGEEMKHGINMLHKQG